MSLPILTTSNAKLLKGHKRGYLTAGIHFAPHRQSGHNVCPSASKGCSFACLNTSGHGIYKRSQDARTRKTNWFFDDREGFMARLIKDIQAVERRALRENLIPAIRLNITSDIQWGAVKYQGKTVFEHFSHIQFYDYSKRIRFLMPDSPESKIPNYHLTFSRSESNEAQVDLAMAMGYNVAVVFAGKLPRTWRGKRVIDSDKSDLRFLDPKGVICGLFTKGRARYDKSGFVVTSHLTVK